MSRALAFVFLSTFVIGFASGFNIFLHTRGELPALPTVDASQGYDITYDTYGACRSMGCLSYHVASDGTATQIVTRNGAQVARRDGTLSSASRTKLIEALQATSLRTTTFESCTPATDKSALRIAVRVGDTTYRYDTCLAAIPEPLGSFLGNHAQWLTF